MGGDDSWKEGGKSKEIAVIITGNKIIEETFNSGLRPEDKDDSSGASLVLKTPFLEKTKVCVKKFQEEKEYGVVGILKKKIDDDVKDNDNRKVAFDSGRPLYNINLFNLT
jgi:hypothetical protein